MAEIATQMLRLTATYRLHQAGIAFRLLAARDRLGGRIYSVDATGTPTGNGFDLGPSWFWPSLGSAITPLVEELGLASFPQYSSGALVFQRIEQEPPRRYPSYRQEPVCVSPEAQALWSSHWRRLCRLTASGSVRG